MTARQAQREDSSSREVAVTPLFPLPLDSSQQNDNINNSNNNSNNNNDLDFDFINCFPVGDVTVVDDLETKMTGIEITGDDSYVEFPLQSTEQFLALQIKNLDRFTKLVLRVVDDSEKTRTLVLSNRRTTVHLKNNVCQLPLELGEGWQYLNLDLVDLTAKCFGTEYVFLSNVMIYGSARVGKVYLQDREYSDLELPPYLRLLPAL